VETVILARHAESKFSVRRVCNGDPAACEGLTDAGREQARALGRLLADDPVALCVTTEFRRTQETADLALEGRGVPRLVVPDLNDIRFGSFEGGLLDDYRRWAHAAAPDEEGPGGGESRAAAAARFARGLRVLLGRPEPLALVVCHALPIRYVLSALLERDPAAVVEPVAHAEPHRFAGRQLERAVERLERWSARPVWAAA
jgi:broad specificity phosphatase PhoE